MPISKSLPAVWILVAGLLAPPGADAGIMSRDGGTVVLPDFGKSAPAGFIATELLVRIECGGVSGVSGVPDGWQFDYRRDGESGVVRVASAEGRTEDPKDKKDRDLRLRGMAGVRIAVIYRGQWSDCFSAWVTLNGLRPDADGRLHPVALHFGRHSDGLDRWQARPHGRDEP